MAVSCAGTTNPYFAPTKAGAEDAGAQLGIEMLWTGVPDGNTVNQIAQFQQLVNTGYQAIVVISFEPDAWIAPIKKAMAARRPGSDLQQRHAKQRRASCISARIWSAPPWCKGRCWPSSPAARARSR